MKMLLFTVHSILNQLAIQICNQILRSVPLMGLAFLAFFVSINSAHSALNIAVLDTGFCPNQITSTNPRIKIQAVTDLTSSVKLDCESPAFNRELPRFHGHQLIEEFLKHLVTDKLEINIYPVIIFNAKGLQQKDYWLAGIDWVKKNKIDFVLSASGLITKVAPSKIQLPGVWFVPSGRTSPHIKKGDGLFPQNLAPAKNLFLIGSYYQYDVKNDQNVLYDVGLLYQDKIDYYFPGGSAQFSGTSRAVAEAAARAINLCPESISKMRVCLKKQSKVLSDRLNKKAITTY